MIFFIFLHLFLLCVSGFFCGGGCFFQGPRESTLFWLTPILLKGDKRRNVPNQ